MHKSQCIDAMRDLLRTSIVSAILLLWPHKTSAAALNPRPTLLSMTQLSTGANLSDTVLTATVPAGFEVVPLAHRGSAIPDLICLDAAVRLMSHLADLNWEDVIEPEAKSVAGVTIETSLTGTARGSRGIQVRYVIWGIYRVIQDLIGGKIVDTVPLDACGELIRWSGRS